MRIELIGMKEFRRNFSLLTKKAKTGGIRFIILKKNVPVLEVNPIDEKKFALEKIARQVSKARNEIKKGKFYSQDEIMEEFGLL